MRYCAFSKGMEWESKDLGFECISQHQTSNIKHQTSNLYYLICCNYKNIIAAFWFNSVVPGEKAECG